jgi:hypothetical protein
VNAGMESLGDFACEDPNAFGSILVGRRRDLDERHQTVAADMADRDAAARRSSRGG